MIQPSKLFAYATAASMLLLACNETTGLNNAPGVDDNTPLSDVAKNKPLESPEQLDQPKPPPGMILVCTDDIPGKCYPINEPSTNPNSPAAIIANDVEIWMKEQLISKSGEKRQVRISDMYLPETTPPGLSAFGRSDRNGEYFVEYSFNGNKISAEEYNRIQQEYRQGINTDKRNLSIPGEIIYENSRSWTVLITAEELVKLSEKYEQLAIEFYIRPQNE